MSKYKIWEQQGLNYLTMTTTGWIDIFSRQRYRDIIIDSALLPGKQRIARCRLGDYVEPSAPEVFTEQLDLSDVLRDFKKFTAHKILESIRQEPESRREWLLYMFKYFAAVNTGNRTFQFWQHDNHTIALWPLPIIWQKLDYIHQNPVRAGMLSDTTHYIYSSASDYFTAKKGLLEIDLIEPIDRFCQQVITDYSRRRP